MLRITAGSSPPIPGHQERSPIRIPGAAQVAAFMTTCVGLAGALWTIREPHYGDAMGYYVPYAHSVFEHPTRLVAESLPTLGHPPLQAVLIAAVWSLTGVNTWVPHAAVLGAAVAALTLSWRFVRAEAGPWMATLSTALILSIPVFQSQARVATPEMMVTAWTMASLVALRGHRWSAAGVALGAATMSKETAIVLLPLVVLWAIVVDKPHGSPVDLRRAASITARVAGPPTLLLMAWIAYHLAMTGGFLDGSANPSDEPMTLMYAMERAAARTVEVTLRAALGPLLMVGVGSAAVLLLRRRLPANVVLASLPLLTYLPMVSLFGHSLARYLLPALPPMVCACVVASHKHRGWLLVAASGTVVLAAAQMWSAPPHNVDPEGSLAYRNVLHRDIAVVRQVERITRANHRPFVALTSTYSDGFPYTHQLGRPYVGYVDRSIAHEVRLDDVGCDADAVINGGGRTPRRMELRNPEVFRPAGDGWSRRYEVIVGEPGC